MNKEGHIDLEQISHSINTLSSIENIINTVDLADNFEEIEKEFKQINFEHSSCINYKESLDLIYANLEKIKKQINELADALRRTKNNYATINTFSEGDIKEFSEIYKTTEARAELLKLVGDAKQVDVNSLTADIAGVNDGNVTTIPAPEPTTPQEDTKIVDTVPIGVGIGVTGIAGSIGAVIVDDMYQKKEKENKVIEDSEIYAEDYNDEAESKVEESYDYNKIRSELGIVQGPYRAARMNREADRYYGGEIAKKIEDDDIEYVDEDDDDYEDF